MIRENADGKGAEQSVTLKLSEEEEGAFLHSRKLSWPSFPFKLAVSRSSESPLVLQGDPSGQRLYFVV